MEPTGCQPGTGAEPSHDFDIGAPPQLALLDFFFPGFSVFSGAVLKYMKIDLNLYIPMVLLFGGLVLAWRYFSEYFWGQLESHFMSTVDIRTDDEIYNILMSWVAAQRFARASRRFVVNTNLNSRSWFLWRWDYDDDDTDEGDEYSSGQRGKQKKALQYTPTFGSHYFWYKSRLLIFRRTQNREQASYLVVSEREEISVSCFGRDPWVLKELLHDARSQYIKRDEQKTLIYRGTTKAGSTEPTWQRSMARTSRPFSTVILNDKVKEDLIEDVKEYLDPATRSWYQIRGIPYRRGYLLYGPPGTGKSSLSLALAGFFKMRIYMVSLNSVTANEENLASLFSELPRRCVVLLEDIDTAGLTHTREDGKAQETGGTDMVPGQVTTGTATNNTTNTPPSRLSLSGLLNILDGVASQEGRVLIMTTNHLEKLDKALIRPGRVDMIVKFGLADQSMISAIFRAIFAPLEGDNTRPKLNDEKGVIDPDEAKKRIDEEEKERAKITAQVEKMAEEFVAEIPAHEFSPAELQGYLLKNKRDPRGAIANAAEWVVQARKDKKEKQSKEAEEKRQAEEKQKKEEEEAKKKKEEEEKKEAEAEEKKKRKEAKKKKKARKERKGKKDSDSSDSSSSDSEDEDSQKKDKEEPKTGEAKTGEPKKEESKNGELETGEPKTEETKTQDAEEAPKDKATKEVADDGRPRTGTDSGYGTP